MSTFLERRIRRLMQEGRVICAKGEGVATVVINTLDQAPTVPESRKTSLAIIGKNLEGRKNYFARANRGYLISHGGDYNEFILAFCARSDTNKWGITATPLTTLHWSTRHNTWEAHMGNIGGIFRASTLNGIGKLKIAWKFRGEGEVSNMSMEEEVESMRRAIRDNQN